MDRKHYPSDISREQYEEIRVQLEGGRRRTRPRRVDLYDVFCAILYLLKNACVWRALPSDFPNVSTVRYYFDLWGRRRSDQGMSVLEYALKKSGGPRTRAQWASRCDELLYRGRAKREEHGHGASERV